MTAVKTSVISVERVDASSDPLREEEGEVGVMMVGIGGEVSDPDPGTMRDVEVEVEFGVSDSGRFVVRRFDFLDLSSSRLWFASSSRTVACKSTDSIHAIKPK